MIICLLCSVDILAQSRYTLKYEPNKLPPKPGPNTDNKSYKLPGDPVPPFKIVSLPWEEIYFERDSNAQNVTKTREITPMRIITNADVDPSKNLLLMFFNPTCGHCEEQTLHFEENRELFKKTQIILVASPDVGEYLNDFAVKTHLNEYPEIWMGMDYDNLISKAYLYYQLPQLCIYDKHDKLIRMMSGGGSIDTLRPYIKMAEKPQSKQKKTKNGKKKAQY
jgi:thiol-disulfide isomerase/thioredoxin